MSKQSQGVWVEKRGLQGCGNKGHMGCQNCVLKQHSPTGTKQPKCPEMREVVLKNFLHGHMHGHTTWCACECVYQLGLFVSEWIVHLPPPSVSLSAMWARISFIFSESNQIGSAFPGMFSHML